MERKKKSTNKKSGAPKIKDLDAQQRKLAIIKQKKCDAVALHIVNKLIDCSVEEDVFLQTLKYLNQCHFQDIVEERAISKMCGYPICSNILPDMPKKQYHISTKSNKIYDITERKNYCSNFCYKAGVYIKDQMLTSPLWFRDKEEIPDFNLLPKSASGIPGEEIDQGLVKLDVHEDENKFLTSVTAFTQDAINEVADLIDDKLNIVSPNTDEVSQKNNTEKNESLPNNQKENDLQYYSNLYMPNLADILQENAKYFSDKPESSSENQENIKPESEKIQKPKKVSEVKNTTSNKPEENIEKKSKSFDRTIINTSKSEQTEGILSNKNKKTEKKKQVSFAVLDEVKYIPKIEPGKKFKKPGSIKNEEGSSTPFKNINVIGTVKETSEIYKTKIESINLSQSEYESNLTNGTNYQINNKKSEQKCITDRNSETEVKEIDNSQTKSSQELRRSKIKNSSVYRNANKISENNRKNQTHTKFGSLKERLKKYVREYTTYETVIFLYGEEIKEILSLDKRNQLDERQSTLALDKMKQKQYDSICKRLNMMEIADRKFDESVTGKKLRPLPKFDELQKEAKVMDLRVQAFYSGCYEVYEDDVESETESVKEEENCPEKGSPAVLPLIESKDILPLRKKIFLSSLSRTIPKICEFLKLCPNTLLSDIKKLIDTFQLTADNIIFKSTELCTVGIILVKMLSIRDKTIKTVMEDSDAQVYVKTILAQFSIELCDLEELLLNEAEIHNILENIRADL